MSSVITILRPDASEQRTVEGTTTGLDLFGSDRTVVAMRVAGEILDLSRDRSLIRWMRGQGFHPWLIDWGRPGVKDRDIDVAGHVERFLRGGDKVKVTIMFRGREQSRPELGFRLLQRLAEDIGDLGIVESQPKQDGRNMVMVIAPTRKKSEAKAEQRRRREQTSRSGHAQAEQPEGTEPEATAS